MSASPEWFRAWFGESYLALYPHRDEAEAEDAVRLLREAGRPDPALPALDLACGAGRHLRAMAAAGLRVVGMDLSITLLREVRRRGGEGSRRLVRGDMRHLPFSPDAFGTVTNFFTSFGYFATPDEDARVTAEIARVLRAEGTFLLDYLNAPRVRRTLVPEEETELDDRTVLQRRWLEGDAVVKRIEIRRPGAEPSVHHERVRLYDAGGLEALLRAHGLEPHARFGDYDGSEHADGSPRLIVLGRRA